MQLPTSKKPGVYMIVNLANRKKYVGSAAKSLRQRAKNHRVELRAGTHPNVHLQRAWRKYGEASFTFVVLQLCPPSRCLVLEQLWMDHFDCFKKGYNRCPVAGSRLGTKMSDETKEKIAKTKRGLKASPEARAKMSASQKVRGEASEHARQRLREGHWSRGPRAADIARRIGVARIGKVYTPEQRANVSRGRLRQLALKNNN